jgi:hypothetical protein
VTPPPLGLHWEEVSSTGWFPPDGFAASIAQTFGTKPGPTVRRARVPGGWFVVMGDDTEHSPLCGWFYPDPDHRWLSSEG